MAYTPLRDLHYGAVVHANTFNSPNRWALLPKKCAPRNAARFRPTRSYTNPRRRFRSAPARSNRLALPLLGELLALELARLAASDHLALDFVVRGIRRGGDEVIDGYLDAFLEGRAGLLLPDVGRIVASALAVGVCLGRGLDQALATLALFRAYATPSAATQDRTECWPLHYASEPNDASGARQADVRMLEAKRAHALRCRRARLGRVKSRDVV